MRNKEFKKLNKAELLEVIYRMQLREQTLTEENEILRKRAEQRFEQLSQSGNIAEAALAIHEVFGSAQKAAEDYVATVSARADEKLQQTLALLDRVRGIALFLRDFLGDLDGEEMGLDGFREQIAGILEESEQLLREEQIPDEPIGEAR